MHPAEEYLRDKANPNSLHVEYLGRKRRLFFNEDDNVIGIVAIGKRIHGHHFSEWNNIVRIYLPEDSRPVDERDVTRKYIREAAKASFTNPFIRKCLAADPNKPPYENGLTSGNAIDGQLISIQTIRKWMPDTSYQMFIEAMQARRSYHSSRFAFQGYEGTIEVRPYKESDTYLVPGDMVVFFSKEYKGCGNGYYYILINDKYFIGNDID